KLVADGGMMEQQPAALVEQVALDAQQRALAALAIEEAHRRPVAIAVADHPESHLGQRGERRQLDGRARDVAQETVRHLVFTALVLMDVAGMQAVEVLGQPWAGQRDPANQLRMPGRSEEHTSEL